MLKGLFNNPWFIGSLGLFAAIYLSWVVAAPFFGGSDTEELAMDDMDILPLGMTADEGEFAADMSTEVSVQVSAADGREHIGWLHDVERDPFAGTELAAEGVAEVVAAAQELPRVEALFVSDGVRAAVINKRLVKVGDRFDSFQVTAIDKYHVQLRAAGRVYRLEPEV